jgi:hypothetical protein
MRAPLLLSARTGPAFSGAVAPMHQHLINQTVVF